MVVNNKYYDNVINIYSWITFAIKQTFFISIAAKLKNNFIRLRLKYKGMCLACKLITKFWETKKQKK